MSGVGKNFYLAWQDEKGLYLPSSISCFSKKEDNEMLYFWLIALMSQVKVNNQNLIRENIKATKNLISKYPGFKEFYLRCSNEIFKHNEDLSFIKSLMEDLTNETANIIPFDMWVYPSLNNNNKFSEFEDEEELDKDKIKKPYKN